MNSNGSESATWTRINALRRLNNLPAEVKLRDSRRNPGANTCRAAWIAGHAEGKAEGDAEGYARAKAEEVQLRTFAEQIFRTFTRDEEQGYRSRDRQYAITMLKPFFGALAAGKE